MNNLRDKSFANYDDNNGSDVELSAFNLGDLQMAAYDTPQDTRIRQLEAENEGALIRAGDGLYRFRRFKMTETALIPPDELTTQEADEFGDLLAGIEKVTNWWRGDWANLYLESVEDDFERGEIYDWLAERFHMNKKTLQNCTAVCRFFTDASHRWEGLSFSHHIIVSGRDDAQDWLQKASDQGWSKSKLQEEVQGKPEKSDDWTILETRVLQKAEKADKQQRQKMANQLRQLADKIETLKGNS